MTNAGDGVVYISYNECILPTIATTFSNTISSRQATYTNVNLNSSASNVAFVSPGASVSLTFDYAIVQNGTLCPGCVTQYYVGIYGFWQDCYRSTAGYCNCSGSESFTITAPTTPGIYYFTEGRGLAFNCATGNTNVENNSNGFAAKHKCSFSLSDKLMT